MKVLIKGAGIYGTHIGLSLMRDGFDVEIHDIGPHVFCGASGNIPARLHLGPTHYPRSYATQRACIEHAADFMDRYGFLTRGVETNIYAIANDISLVDFGTYRRIMQGQIEFVTIYDPSEYGLRNVEGAVLTGERHIVTDLARAYFERELDGSLFFNSDIADDALGYDWVVDCTFAANSAVNVDRYEPCLVLALEGPTNRAITLMDSPELPSLYPWNEEKSLCSLSSAKFTPFSKSCKTYQEARDILDDLSGYEIADRAEAMLASMEHYYPQIREFRIADYMFSIRAMPLSGADTRLVDVARQSDRLLRVRAGKIDAILDAERLVKAMICSG